MGLLAAFSAMRNLIAFGIDVAGESIIIARCAGRGRTVEVSRHPAERAAEALAGLGALELGGWARQCPGMRFQRVG